MGKRKKQQKKKEVNDEAPPNEIEEEEEEKTETNYTVDDLLERVENYVEAFQFDLALKFCEKATQLEPSNTKVLETTGNVCAEMGDIVKAEEYYMKAVKIQPDKGFVKYLYLGQISQGKAAVEFFLTAINVMKSELNNTEAANVENLKLQLSNVYCSLAELYMTDCCMEEDAQKQCEKYCQEAIESNEKNPDAYLNMCNYLLSSNEMEKTKETLAKVYDLWKTFTEQDLDHIPSLIAYESRLTLVKLLIEAEEYDKVSSIVDQLIEENEDDVRIWYYLGLAKNLLFENDNTLDNPRFYLEKALELFEKTGVEDIDMKEHIEEILKVCPLEEDMETISEGEEEEIESDEEEDQMET